MTPTVSVCMVTYQHAAFIKDAIEGALAQEADFPLEILVGEDGSTDGTREICLDYARRQPDRIRASLRDRTEVLSGGKPAYIARNFLMTLREARGEFIALCEGDDYWTDPTKLQRQVDYLRANPDCSGCFHDAKLIDASGQTLLESYFQSDQDKFTQRDVLETLLSREPTCSLVFRRSALKEPLPEWYLRLPCDLHLDILLTNCGPLGFLRRNMAAYRKHGGGMWSGQREANQLIELIFRYKMLLADNFFLSNYRELLLRKISGFQDALFTNADFAGELLRLEKIVVEQTAVLVSSEQRRISAQRDIDRLTQQVAGLGTTEKAQRDYVAILEVERNRLTSDLAEAGSNAKRIHGESELHLASLRKQHDELGGTCQTQAGYIAVLEAERNRLTPDFMKAQRNAKRVQAESEANFTATRTQMENLVATCKEQTSYIAILEAEKIRLTSELREAQVHVKSMQEESKTLLGRACAQAEHLVAEVKHYVSVIEEQLSYIKILEAERDQTNAGAK